MAPRDAQDVPDHGDSAPRDVDSDKIRVEDKVYSAPRLADFHPGGPLFIRAFAGRDATEAFLSYHRRAFPHKRAVSAFEFQDDSVDLVKTEELKDEYLELCRRVEKVLPRQKSFAPWFYFVKVLAILGAAVGLEYYVHSRNAYAWPIMAALGVVYAWIGLNIQHDANHGAVSRRPIVNRVLGMSQNWIGGSAISWIHQHVVQHHIHTNDVHLDPDMEGSFLIRINPLKPLMKFHIVQHIYFFTLLAFYGFAVVYQSLMNVVHGRHFTPMSPFLKPHRVFETATWFVFFSRWIIYPLYQNPSAMLTTLLNVCPMFMTAGYYLAFFFTISHNFAGVYVVDQQSPKRNRSYLYNQVITSSNVGGAVLCQLNGGLNYQIEHHLFPRIHHSHYPTIAPVVRRFCEERAIPYVHFDSVTDNISSCVEHLFDYGSNERPVKTNYATK